jgi:hypothetical protein
MTLCHCAFWQEPKEQSYFAKFLTLPQVRQAIHVGNQNFSDGAEVEKHLREDTVKSVKPWLSEIMNYYKVSRGPWRTGIYPKLLGYREQKEGNSFYFLLYFLLSKDITYSIYKIEIAFLILFL